MDLSRFLIETHLRTGRPIKELARVHHVSPSWLFKLWRGYRLEGPAGLGARSRRPRSSPTRIADVWEDEVVTLRKELLDFGADAGAQTIHYHLAKRHKTVPSQSTIWRVLRARGFVTEQPHKRPRSSYRRFVSDLPNECWQADITHVTLEDGAVFEVLNMIDDHSRLCVASRAFVTVKATDVVRTLHRSAETWGYPASMLTDNGLVFSAQRRHGVVGTFEQELFSLGIATKHSRPYHPQTCGKVERFHQTLKKFLAVQDGVVTKKQLQAQLDRFTSYYNEIRPHRALRRHTPIEAFTALERARPTGALVEVGNRKLMQGKVDKKGAVTIRYRGRVHHIGIGAAYKGWRIWMLVDRLNIEIVAVDGSPLRRLRLDPAKDYQPMA